MSVVHTYTARLHSIQKIKNPTNKHSHLIIQTQHHQPFALIYYPPPSTFSSLKHHTSTMTQTSTPSTNRQPSTVTAQHNTPPIPIFFHPIQHPLSPFSTTSPSMRSTPLCGSPPSTASTRLLLFLASFNRCQLHPLIFRRKTGHPPGKSPAKAARKPRKGGKTKTERKCQIFGVGVRPFCEQVFHTGFVLQVRF